MNEAEAYRIEWQKKYSDDRGKEIVAFINKLGLWKRKKVLEYKEWHRDCVIATDKHNRRYIIFGCYSDYSYLFTSILREVIKGKPTNWEINGQPSKNSELVADLREHRIEFPELKEATEKWIASLDKRTNL
jgi:hypothetical protein